MQQGNTNNKTFNIINIMDFHIIQSKINLLDNSKYFNASNITIFILEILHYFKVSAPTPVYLYL